MAQLSRRRDNCAIRAAGQPVADANAIVARLDEMGAEWLSKLEDRDGTLFATAVDPDGSYVQIIQMSEEARAAMS